MSRQRMRGLVYEFTPASSAFLIVHAKCRQWSSAPHAHWQSGVLRYEDRCWPSGCQDSAVRRNLPPARSAWQPFVDANPIRLGMCRWSVSRKATVGPPAMPVRRHDGFCLATISGKRVGNVLAELCHIGIDKTACMC